MYTAAVPLTTTVALLLYFTTLVGCVEVFSSISPSTNVFIPYTSTDDVVFTCTVAGADDGYSVLWQLSGLQIHATNMNRYIIQPSDDNRVSNLTVTQEGRRYIDLEVISVECHADKDDAFGLILGKQVFYIVQFDPPGEVENLKLSYNSQQKLILQWSRPLGIHPDVPITYLVLIINNSTATVTQMNVTIETHVLVGETRETVCQPHVFSVTAMNEAGNSSASIIMDSIPISLGIGPVASSQKVDQLLLLGTSANITVSFQPATNCSEQFPILNYTVSILGLEGSVVVDDPSPSNLLLSVTLTSANIPLLSVDQRYSIVITACSNFACRSPAQPLVAVTTDTQTASAVFYSTAVSLNCSFAAGSSARGCVFVFHLTNENRSENTTVYYTSSGDLVMFNTSCDLLTNTRGAYNEQVLVYDIEADGTFGTYPITATVVVEDEPDNFTCPLPIADVESGGIGAGAIAGIVLVTVFAVIFCVLFIVMVIIHLRVRQIQKIHAKTEGADITWLDGLKLLFETSTEDIDSPEPEDKSVELEDYPVAKLWRSLDNQSVRVEMLNCKEAKDWGTIWLGGRRRYARLYPEKNRNE